MIVDLEYIGKNQPKIVLLSPAGKRDVKALRLTKEESDRAAVDKIWLITLSQGEGRNYCDHCYVWESVLFQAILIGTKGAIRDSIDTLQSKGKTQ